jgi:hypothetical protein
MSSGYLDIVQHENYRQSSNVHIAPLALFVTSSMQASIAQYSRQMFQKEENVRLDDAM